MAKTKKNAATFEELQEQINELSAKLDKRKNKLSDKARKAYTQQIKALKKQAKPLQKAYDELRVQQAGFSAAYDVLLERLKGKSKDSKKTSKKKSKKVSKKNSKPVDTELVVKAPTKDIAAETDAKAAGIEPKSKPRKTTGSRAPKASTTMGAATASSTAKPRRRGRPPGSKNSTSSTKTATATTSTSTNTSTNTKTPQADNGSTKSPETNSSVGKTTTRRTRRQSKPGFKLDGTPRKKPGRKAGPKLPAGKRADGSDNLSAIKGIGPTVDRKLVEGGITTFAQLSRASVTRLKALIASAGPRYRNHDPSPWKEQAKLAAAGKWDQMD